MAALTPLSGITFTAAEIAALQVAPSVTDPVGMQSSMVADLAEMIHNLNAMIALLPAGTNKTTLSTLVTTLG